MWTVTATLAVRPEITGSLMDINSIVPPSWEAVMLTFTTDEAKATLLNDYFASQTDLKIPLSHLEYVDKSGDVIISWEQAPASLASKSRRTSCLACCLTWMVLRRPGSDLVPCSH